MATPAQINANRLNAEKSTGPRSVEGKTVSRFNALKHGIDARSLIIPGEDPEALESLTRALHDQFRPANPVEAFLVETLVRCDWTKRRLRVIEAQVINAMLAGDDAPDLGTAFIRDAEGPNALEKIFRHQNAQERAFFRALNELRQLQAQRPPESIPEALAEAMPEAAPQPTPAATRELVPFPVALPKEKDWLPSDKFAKPSLTQAELALRL